MAAAPVEMGVAGVRLEPGDHVCAFYRGTGGRDEILLPFLRSGVERHDKCIAVLDETDGDAVRATLRDDPGLATSDDSLEEVLELWSSSDTYLSDGRFSTDAMLGFWTDHIVASLQEPGRYDFVRCLGEMTWALRQMPGVEELVGYESELNRLMPESPKVIVCLYDIDRFDGQVVVDLLHTHPKILLCGTLMANPYYLEPDEFRAHRDAAAVP